MRLLICEPASREACCPSSNPARNLARHLESGKNQCRRQPLTVALFAALCLNLLLAPTAYTATEDALTRKVAYAIVILLLVTVSLSVYLFAVILQPERFSKAEGSNEFENERLIT
ncbi:MAG: K(+)-transporting ATPase subunit F [Cyanobacteria bacterium J06636_16]